MFTLQSFTFIIVFFLRNTGLGTDIFIKLEYIARSLVKIKSIPDWHLFISRMERKWTKWYAMTSHVIAYRSLELLFGTHTFHFNCFLRILIAYLRKYAAYLGCCLTSYFQSVHEFIFYNFCLAKILMKLILVFKVGHVVCVFMYSLINHQSKGRCPYACRQEYWNSDTRWFLDLSVASK